MFCTLQLHYRKGCDALPPDFAGSAAELRLTGTADDEAVETIILLD